MEHKSLSMEHDKNLIGKILDDLDMRYILLFLYIIRNDLFKDLKNLPLIESYDRILILDEIFKSNILNFLDKDFIGIAIDLGLFKNVRSLREFEQKDDDFIIKLGEETITIEKNTISVPDDTLFLIINKKFKSISRRNFNLALTRLKSVRCETKNLIHPFIYEIDEHDYTLSDDLYYILDQYGNIYQAIKMEITIEGFYDRLKEIKIKINNFIELFDRNLNSKSALKKIRQAIVENKNIIKYLKDEKIQLSDKFNLDKIDKESEIFKKWNSKLLALLNYRYKLEDIDKKLMEIKRIYSGKERENSYLEFIEKVSFNEEKIVEKIQNSLIELRKDVVNINNDLTSFSKKQLKLLNLDYERYIITSSDD